MGISSLNISRGHPLKSTPKEKGILSTSLDYLDHDYKEYESPLSHKHVKTMTTNKLETDSPICCHKKYKKGIYVK